MPPKMNVKRNANDITQLLLMKMLTELFDEITKPCLLAITTAHQQATTLRYPIGLDQRQPLLVHHAHRGYGLVTGLGARRPDAKLDSKVSL